MNSHTSLEILEEIYKLVGDSDFIVKGNSAEIQVPEIRYISDEYKHMVRKLELQGYIVRSGSVRIWYYDRYKDYLRYRIAQRYLQRFRP